MSSAVTWTFNLTVVGGPSLSLTPAPASVAAYDSITATIPTGGTPTDVEVASFNEGESAFIIITSSQYDQSAKSSGETLTFSVWVNSAQAAPSTGTFSLDGPLFLMSPLVSTLLIPAGSLTPPTGGTAPPKNAPTGAAVAFQFTNNTSNPANISILVGRTASP